MKEAPSPVAVGRALAGVGCAVGKSGAGGMPVNLCVITLAGETFDFMFVLEASAEVPTRAAGGHGRLCSALPRFDLEVALVEARGLEAGGLTE